MLKFTTASLTPLKYIMGETAPINPLIILKLINEINSQQKVSLRALSSLHDSVCDDDKNL